MSECVDRAQRKRGAIDVCIARTVAVVCLALLFVVASADAAGTSPGLRFYTIHGTFLVGAVSASETNKRGGVEMDGLLNPNAPSILLRRGERVRVSLPALPDGAQVLYTAAKLGYRNVMVDLDLSNPVWRPSTFGTYVISIGLEATWKSDADAGTLRSTWAIKVSVKR